MQDKRSKDDALRSKETNAERIEKERKKVADFEASLDKEEKILEEIRDSLKGQFSNMEENVI